MAPPVDRLYVMSQELMAAVESYYADQNEALPPEGRRMVTAGPPAHDCDLLAVWLERTFGYSGDLTSESPNQYRGDPGHVLRGAAFGIEVVRCVAAVEMQGTTIVLPAAAEQEADALRHQKDAQMLENAVLLAHAAGDIGNCHTLVVDGGEHIEPSGGVAAWRLKVRLGIGRVQ